MRLEAILIAIWVALIGLFVCWSSRIREVYAEQMRVLELLDRLAKADIQAGRAWEWRYREFDKAHRRMYWQLWRPVDSYFVGPAFTDGGSANE